MTVNTQVKKVSAVGDGATRTFSFSPIVIYANDELEVITTVIATGVETEISQGSSSTTYSISIAANGYPDTGSIDYPASGGTLIPNTVRISIRHKPTIENLTDLSPGKYDPAVQETQYDKFTRIMLLLQEQVDRCLKLPVSSTDVASALVTEIATPISGDGTKSLVLNAAETAFALSVASTTTGSASDSTPADVNLSAGAAGSNAAYSRDDHAHFLPTTVPRLATENVYTESQVWFKGSDVTAAGAMTLGAGNIFDIDGSTPIATITTIGVGTVIILHFNAATTITHNASDMVLPGAEDISTFVGYELMLLEYATGDWRFISDNADIAVYRRSSVDFTLKTTLQTDFHGDTLDGNLWNATAGGGSGNAVAMSAGAGGRYSLLTSSADEGATHANGASGISSAALNWRADQGGLTLEARIQVDDITSVAIFVGFTDVESTTVELPIFKTVGADTIDSDAVNACGVGFDTDGTTDQWFHGGVKANTDTAATHSGSAPVNDTWATIRVEVGLSGAVRGFINGIAIGTATFSAVTATTPLTPVIFVCQRTGSARTLLVDYIWCQASR
ncbi:hypothetical protein LCGC14_0903480 [marine sediment metagenome]|uniref:Uncharacterized protein n=1 Tax=marine sediment metagenome TaxID=412755 RepID=A0A0F9P0E2_9ZZZZ